MPRARMIGASLGEPADGAAGDAVGFTVGSGTRAL